MAYVAGGREAPEGGALGRGADPAGVQWEPTQHSVKARVLPLRVRK